MPSSNISYLNMLNFQTYGMAGYNAGEEGGMS